MRKLFVLLVALGVLGAASCETLNVGSGLNPNRFQITGVSFSTTSPVAGSDVTATINFQGVSGPFTFTVTFSDGVTPLVHTVTAPNGATSATLTFTTDPFLLADDPDGLPVTVTVTGTDANGSVGGPVSGTFTITGIPNQLPTITTAFNPATDTVTATVGDLDNEDVTVSATTVPASLTTPANQTVTGGNGTADFTFSATDIIAGGSGDVTFTATDASGGTATSTVTVTVDPVALAADTLYAVPTSTSVAVNTPVTIIVLSGDPASPFQYMTGVRVTAPDTSGFDYVDDSFNVGMPGGDPDAIDGIWADDELGLGDGDFLLAPDSFYAPVPAAAGFTGIDFNVTPLNAAGNVTTGEGALFNFQATFDTPGTYPLGFELFNTVNRTYYQDNNQAPDYFWADITNNHAGIPNTVTVN